MYIPFKTINRVIKDEELRPHDSTNVQKLLPRDFEPRMVFARWFFVHNEDLSILWIHVALFTNNGVFKRLNYHYYSIDNSNVVIELNQTGHQHQFECLGRRYLATV